MIPSNSRSNQNQLNKQGLQLLPVPVLFAWMPAPQLLLGWPAAAAPGRPAAERAAEWGVRAGQSAGCGRRAGRRPAEGQGARAKPPRPSGGGAQSGAQSDGGRSPEGETGDRRRGRPATSGGGAQSVVRLDSSVQSRRARRCDSSDALARALPLPSL